MQNNNTIYLSVQDADRLRTLLPTLGRNNLPDSDYVKSLESEVNRATIVPSDRMSNEVVQMNSRVRLTDLTTGEESEFQIVYPSEADFENGRISVLSPVGTALLGCRVKDTVSWNVPGGTRKLKIEKIMDRPKAVGDFFQ